MFTYDLWQDYVRKDRPDDLLPAGRPGRHRRRRPDRHRHGVHRGGLQQHHELHPALFRFFNAPLFATFIIAMFWKRTTPWAGFCGLIAGFIGAVAFQYLIGPNIAYFYPGRDTSAEINAQMLNFYAAIVAFVVDAVVTVAVTLVTKPKPVEQLAGLVWGVPDPAAGDPHEGYVRRWWESPKLLGFTALGLVAVLSIIFI